MPGVARGIFKKSLEKISNMKKNWAEFLRIYDIVNQIDIYRKFLSCCVFENKKY